MCKKFIMPKVMAIVIGMDIARRSADRHSQNPTQRDDHDQDDSLVQAVHEQTHALLNLLRLVGRACDDEILGQPLLDTFQSDIHIFREPANLFSRAHVNSEGNGTHSLPIP